MSEELKPCPFCGGKPEITDGRVYCPYFECQIGGSSDEVPTFTIDMWNTRPTEDVLRAELSRVHHEKEDALDKLENLRVELEASLDADEHHMKIRSLQQDVNEWTEKCKRDDLNYIDRLNEEIARIRAELEAAQVETTDQSVWAKKLEAAVDDAGRMMEEAKAERNVAQGKIDDLREMAQELKRQHAEYLYADSIGYAVEWHGKYGERYRKLESELMEKLIGE